MGRLELLSRLGSGDTGFLKELSDERLAEALRLGPGGAFYLSRHERRLNRPAQEEALLRIELSRGTEPFKAEAGKTLLRKLMGEGRAKDSLAISRELLKENPDDGDIRSLHIDALFEAGRDGELISALSSGETAEEWADPKRASRLSFYSAVAACRQGDWEWADLFRSLFEGEALPQVTVDAVRFINASEPRRGAFLQAELDFWGARSAIAERDYGVALKYFTQTGFGLSGPSRLPIYVSDAGKAWLYSGAAKEGLPIFEAFRETLRRESDFAGKSALEFYATYYIARFHRALGQGAAAAEEFASSLPLAPNAAQTEAALWYFFDELSKISPARAIPSLAEYSSHWPDPETFSDTLMTLVVALVKGRNFEGLEALFRAVTGRTTPLREAQLSYLVGRALQLGLIPGGAERAESLFRAAIEDDESGFYYRFLASARLGGNMGLVPSEDGIETSGEPSMSFEPGRSLEIENYLNGFFEYGLKEDVGRETAQRIASLSPAAVRQLSRRLAESGLSSDSMQIIRLLAGIPGYLLTREDMELLYPRNFSMEIEAAARNFGLPEYVLYALIRTESSFMPRVESRAGAIGLSQLMPSTARQAGERIGLASADLRNPAANIMIGAYYLSDLQKKLDGKIMPALFAYNGGIGRMRKWEAEVKGLEGDLFLETVPIEETRDYGRKVLSSAAVYGYLYYGKSPEEVVREVFNE